MHPTVARRIRKSWKNVCVEAKERDDAFWRTDAPDASRVLEENVKIRPLGPAELWANSFLPIFCSNTKRDKDGLRTIINAMLMRCPDLRQFQLGLCAAMTHRLQQGSILWQSGQGSRLAPIILSTALDDQMHPLRMNRNHFAPQRRQQPANPGGMCSRLSGHPDLRHATEYLLHVFRCGCQSVLQNYLSCFI